MGATDCALPLGAIAGEVRFEDVSFEYNPGVPVLKGVSLKFNPGERVAILGRIGSGKSTVALQYATAAAQRGEGDVRPRVDGNHVVPPSVDWVTMPHHFAGLGPTL